MQAAQDQGTTPVPPCLVIPLNHTSVQRHGRHVRIATGADVSREPSTRLNSSPILQVVCRYPDVFKHARRDYIQPETPSPRQIVRLSDTPTIYSPDDMQLFHHYLISAHPCIPHDWKDLWVKDIPVKANQVSATLLRPCNMPVITDYSVPISYGCYARSGWVASSHPSRKPKD
jgi:hypothetical protein